MSVRLAAFGVSRGISRFGGWFEINVFVDNADAGATSVGGVGVSFDAEEMRGIE